MGKKRGAYKILEGTHGRRRSTLGSPRHRWKDNIKMDLQEVGWGMELINLAQTMERWQVFVKEVTNFRVP
jgi:hypothetical protein